MQVQHFGTVQQNTDGANGAVKEPAPPLCCLGDHSAAHDHQQLRRTLARACARLQVSYKLLIQSWFKEVAELANENDRIGALDNIPPAIRRANPNITRDYYLRMRSQVSACACPRMRAASMKLSKLSVPD